MTTAQQSTVSYFEGIARENGSTFEVSEQDGTVYLTETASAEWDNERTTWTLDPEGNATLL